MLGWQALRACCLHLTKSSLRAVRADRATVWPVRRRIWEICGDSEQALALIAECKSSLPLERLKSGCLYVATVLKKAQDRGCRGVVSRRKPKITIKRECETMRVFCGDRATAAVSGVAQMRWPRLLAKDEDGGRVHLAVRPGDGHKAYRGVTDISGGPIEAPQEDAGGFPASGLR